MDYETVFSICSGLAMLGWVGLVLLPRNRFVVEQVATFWIPGLIGAVYVGLMASNLSQGSGEGGFGSLAGVMALFTVESAVLAGWVHYLAFDLFVGAWIVRDSQRQSVHHLVIVPCLLLTLMAGPAGLLLYLAVRWVKRVRTEAVAA